MLWECGMLSVVFWAWLTAVHRERLGGCQWWRELMTAHYGENEAILILSCQFICLWQSLCLGVVAKDRHIQYIQYLLDCVLCSYSPYDTLTSADVCLDFSQLNWVYLIINCLPWGHKCPLCKIFASKWWEGFTVDRELFLLCLLSSGGLQEKERKKERSQDILCLSRGLRSSEHWLCPYSS